MADGDEMERREDIIRHAIDVVRQAVGPLPAEELDHVAGRLRQALDAKCAPEEQKEVLRLLRVREYTEQERIDLEVQAFICYVVQRRHLLQGSMDAAQVAALLQTSRAALDKRVNDGRLLAVDDRGELRFPAWQFDPEGEDGVVKGLPVVIQRLRVPALSKMDWLVRPNPYLDGATALARIKAGEVERVLALAAGVGVI